jgi:uncharacterized membrane protein HdeD (DUF308 family)
MGKIASLTIQREGAMNKINDKSWKWSFTIGLLIIVVGVFSITMPVVSTVGLTYGLATVLIISGVLHLIHSLKLKPVHSIVAIVIGLLMLRFPGQGMLGIAYALSFYFFIRAATLWLFFYYLTRNPYRTWGLLTAVLSFALGVFIILTFPFSALWIPGVVLGIDLIFSGTTMIGSAISTRKRLGHHSFNT